VNGKATPLTRREALAATAALASYAFASRGALAQSDQLPSWNDGAAKKGDHRFRLPRHNAGRGGLADAAMDRGGAGRALRRYREPHQCRARIRLPPPVQDRQLDKAWDQAKAKGWTIVDMKQDWKKIFAFKPEDL